MQFRYKQCRQLNDEITEVECKLGTRPDNPLIDIEMRVEEKATVSKGPIPSRNKPKTVAQKKNSPPSSKERPVCSQKSCYCRQDGDSKDVKTTWDAILSQNGDTRATNKIDKGCQAEQMKEAGNGMEVAKEGRRVLNDWCHPGCFVQDLAHNKPNELLGLKRDIDKAVLKMGYRDNGIKKEPSRSKLVLEYLEELSVEMLKKRLEESELRCKNMKKQLEETLVAQNIKIQNLKKELYAKSEEVNRLLKTKSEDDTRREVVRELEFIERATGLNSRVNDLMDRDQKCQAELNRYKAIASNVQAELVCAKQENDRLRAKMDIYRSERDQAVVSLSVYETTFKNLKTELGQEIRGMLRPQLDLTADSFGTLDATGREPRKVVTSSPNTSLSQLAPLTITDDRTMTTISKLWEDHKIKRSIPEKTVNAKGDGLKEEKTHGEALLKTLQVLGKEFKQFTENVIPLALGLDNEAHQLLVATPSTGSMSWTDLSLKSFSSIDSTPQ